MKLLHIIASPRGSQSRTLKVSSSFLEELKKRNEGIQIDELDLYKEDLPEVTGNIIDAKYALMGGMQPADESMDSWGKIVAYSQKFMEYDAFLISNPIWNFSVPYKLKHYIDVVMQAGILFNFTPTGVEGLAKGKRMVCITSRGSDYSKGTAMHAYDFQEPYLRSIFGFAGIYNISFIHAQPLDMAPQMTENALEKAMAAARILAQQF